MTTQGSNAKKKTDDRKTASEVIDTVTGYDEQAVLEVFGVDFWDVHDAAFKVDDAPTKTQVNLFRVLGVIAGRHQGRASSDVYDEVMAMTPAEVMELFANEKPGDDPDADKPSAVGNDEGTPA